MILSDNLKSAVLERMGEAIRFNPQYLAFVRTTALSRVPWRWHAETRRAAWNVRFATSATTSLPLACLPMWTISTPRPRSGVRQRHQIDLGPKVPN